MCAPLLRRAAAGELGIPEFGRFCEEFDHIFAQAADSVCFVHIICFCVQGPRLLMEMDAVSSPLFTAKSRLHLMAKVCLEGCEPQPGDIDEAECPESPSKPVRACRGVYINSI
jgi:hypothetical protein